jgi:hypothetical protein
VRGSFPNLLEKLLEPVSGSLRLDLDGAVVPVANPTVDAQAVGVVTREVPESYALHATVDDHVDRFVFFLLIGPLCHQIAPSFGCHAASL